MARRRAFVTSSAVVAVGATGDAPSEVSRRTKPSEARFWPSTRHDDGAIKKGTRLNFFKHTRAQATAFIIVGIIMVVLVSMMLSMTSKRQLAPLEKSFSEVADVLRTETVRNVVELCIQKTAVDGIRLLAGNGGEMDPLSFMDFGGNQVKYWIPERAGQADDETYPSARVIIDPVSRARKNDPPGSGPPFDYWLADGPNLAAEKRFPFGDMPVTALCQKGGPNDKEQRQGSIAPPCPAGFYADLSIQGALKDYIVTNAKECVKPDKIKELGGFTTVEFRIDVPDVEVIIGEEDVVVDVKYPIVVGVEKASREVVQYHVSIPARLKRIYGLAQNLISRDRTELSFDISEKEHQKQSEYFDKRQEESISIEVKCPKCADKKYDDAISILDKASSLSGQPLVFNIARANRRPVLSFIHDGKDAAFREGKFKPFDLLFEYETAGTKIEFDILAYDPDEDAIHFGEINADEWNKQLKEECWGKIKKEGEEEDIDLKTVTAGEIADNPPEDQGPVIANYADMAALNTCIQDEVADLTSEWIVTPQEPELGDTHAFRATVQRTDRALQPLDFGYHTFTVTVCDDHNDDIATKDVNALCDSQEVVILVVDKLEG